MLKNLLGAFVDFEEGEKPAAATTVPAATAPAAPSTTAAPVPLYDQTLVDTFQKTVGARKTPFTALLEKEEILKAAISDETTRTKAAFTMIVAEGRNLDSILQAIDIHIADIASELLRIKGAAENASNTKVSALRASAKASTDLRDSNLAKIADLQKQIETLQAEANNENQKSIDLSNQADAAEHEIGQVVLRATEASDFVKNGLHQKKTALASTLSA
jgi:chromosome segregation ATPase